MNNEQLIALGPDGPLAGTLTLPDRQPAISDNTPVVLIVPGSGPTDRDGNSPRGLSAGTYRLLAEGLAAAGIPAVRIDKRGMFGSSQAIADANDVTIADYADDVLAWTKAIRERLPREDRQTRRVVLLGHSEGGLVVLAAAKRMIDPIGLILIACPGRPLADILYAQLCANPANAPLLKQARQVISTLQRGGRVAADRLDPALASLFADAVQPFLIDLFSYDPVALVSDLTVPILILQGERDLQVATEDAQTLRRAAKNGTLTLVPDMNHVLKSVPDADRAANLMSYSNPTLPLAEGVMSANVHFVVQLAESCA